MKLTFILITSLIMTACGKNVSKSTEQALQSAPITQPITQEPILETLIMAFSNHAEIGSFDQLPTSYQFKNDSLFFIPNVSMGTSFENGSHPYLGLYYNNNLVCSYQWNQNKYQEYGNCPKAIFVKENDKITFTGIPAGQTIWFLLEYQK